LLAAPASSRRTDHKCRHTILEAVGTTLQYRFLGQLVDMLVVAVLIGRRAGGGWRAADPYAGAVRGIAELIPFIGALAGSVPAVLIASGQSPTQALWVAALFAAVQALEGNVIAPLIQKRTVALPPALTIFSQTILGTLFGVLGLILATPAMAALLVLVRMAYVGDVLEQGPGDKAKAPCPGRASGRDQPRMATTGPIQPPPWHAAALRVKEP